ncbi:TRAP transporter substrate-binding protein [Chloroflexota bacterium]
MKNRRLIAIAASICLIVVFLTTSLLVGCGTKEAEVIELSWNSHFNAQHGLYLAGQYYADRVNEETNGRVVITTFPTGTLSSAPEVFEGVVAGVSDIGAASPAYTPGRFPAVDSTSVPLPSKSAYVTSHMGSDFWFHFQPAEWDDVHVLWIDAAGPYVLSSTDKQIKTPADLKGLKLRASGPQAAAFAAALGGTPVSVPMPEVYEAASKGILDVLVTPVETHKGWRHAEVTKYVTKLPVTFTTPGFSVMNMDKWNALPADIQKIMTDLAQEQLEVQAKVWRYIDIEGEQYFLSLGGGREIYVIPDSEAQIWVDLVIPVINDYIKEKTALGLPAADYVKYNQERAEYWNARIPDDQEVIDFVEKEVFKTR